MLVNLIARLQWEYCWHPDSNLELLLTLSTLHHWISINSPQDCMHGISATLWRQPRNQIEELIVDFYGYIIYSTSADLRIDILVSDYLFAGAFPTPHCVISCYSNKGIGSSFWLTLLDMHNCARQRRIWVELWIMKIWRRIDLSKYLFQLDYLHNLNTYYGYTHI